MLDNEVYKHTLRVYNTYCFVAATIVTRTRLNITLYIHYMSFGGSTQSFQVNARAGPELGVNALFQIPST
jgi:hypothetical protein